MGAIGRVKKNILGDCLILGEILAIGLVEVSHLAAVFLNLSFTRCAMLTAGLLGVLLVFGTGFLIVKRKYIWTEAGGESLVNASARRKILQLLFVLMVISQLIFVGIGNAIYRQGDMTVETVGSFLASDGIYHVNPLTGMPYTEGMPLRLKILCLPTLYGSLCKWTGLSPALVVQRIVPMAVLLSSYVAFSVLGRTLFPEDAEKRAWFLFLVSFLLWVGAYRYGMEGFDLLCCGYRGVAIRGGVLLPWTVSLCLRRRRLEVLLCVLAEACIVWTFYGLGMCLAVAAGMTVVQLCCDNLRKRVENIAAQKVERGDVT